MRIDSWTDQDILNLTMRMNYGWRWKCFWVGILMLWVGMALGYYIGYMHGHSRASNLWEKDRNVTYVQEICI